VHKSDLIINILLKIDKIMEEMDANQVKALKYLIKASPAGEIQDILTHVSTLVGSPEALTTNPSIVAAIK